MMYRAYAELQAGHAALSSWFPAVEMAQLAFGDDEGVIIWGEERRGDMIEWEAWEFIDWNGQMTWVPTAGGFQPASTVTRPWDFSTIDPARN